MLEKEVGEQIGVPLLNGVRKESSLVLGFGAEARRRDHPCKGWPNMGNQRTSMLGDRLLQGVRT